MMALPAWKDLMDDVKLMLDSTNTLSGVTVDNLGYKQGEVSIMRWLLALADTSEKAYDQLKEEDAYTP